MRKRFFANGEPTAGTVLHAPYLRIAQGLLDAVKMQMRASGLQQLGQQYTTETGVTIRATSRFGQDEIWIDVPVGAPKDERKQREEEVESFFLWVGISRGDGISEQSVKSEAHQYNSNGIPTGRVIEALPGHSFGSMLCAHGALWALGNSDFTPPSGEPTGEHHYAARYDLRTGEGVALDINPCWWAAHLVATADGVIHVDSDNTNFYVTKFDKEGARVAQRTFSHTSSSAPWIVAASADLLVLGVHNAEFFNEDNIDDDYWLTLRTDDLTTVSQTGRGVADLYTWDSEWCDLVYSAADDTFHAVGIPYFWEWDADPWDVTTRAYSGRTADELVLSEMLAQKTDPFRTLKAIHVVAGRKLVRIVSETGDTVIGVGSDNPISLTVPKIRHTELVVQNEHVTDYASCVAWDTFGGVWLAPRGQLWRLDVATGRMRQTAATGDYDYHTSPIAVQHIGKEWARRSLESARAHKHRFMSPYEHLQTDLNGPTPDI